MRVLLTTLPGFGHFQPIVPLAHALRRGGHVVAVATAPSFAEAVARAGLEFVPAGLDWDESRLLETLPEVADEPKEYQGEWLMRRIFLDRSPRQMVPDLIEVAARWRPDVIVSGTYEFGGALAAELLDLPYASCSISFRWNRWILKNVAGRPLARLRRSLGLPLDQGFTAFGRHLDLCFVPPSWVLTNALLRPELTQMVRRKTFGHGISLHQRVVGLRALAKQRLLALDHRLHPEHGAVGTTTHFIRNGDADGVAAPLPAWWHDLPPRPIVYVSLGTVFSAQYPHVFDTILAGLRDEPLNLILTVGRDVDPARFGPQPASVRIERFIPAEILAAMLPHVSLCINHAGFGTVIDALTHGIPLVLLPLSADQPVIAQSCLINGVAPDLPAAAWRISAKGLPIIRPDHLTPDMIRQATTQVLLDPRFRQAAAAARDEIAVLPGLSHAVDLLAASVAGEAIPKAYS
ncbi:glycosyltransferase [Sphingomonas sp. Tas61C01]|uniref:glycosyltransferase n=1 Tax=Sphingomonas sp. Tas61C01 TaxID=3458297 RepID=UPI00403EA77C